ncbi:MAG: multicopper oxidase domain-containing protein [bacterium]|nr:multicopper oxidase domain-containing protein [bacterium]
MPSAAFIAGLAALAIALAALPLGAEVVVQCPPDTDGIDTDGDGDPDNDVVCVHSAAGDGFINMADGRLQYIFGFSDVTGVPPEMVMHMGMLAAEFPAPTIVVREGQRLYLTLTNVGMMMRPDLFDPHTIHWHGFPEAAPIFDGEPFASISINMGSSLTYFYNVVEPGTYMYHCHVEAVEHMQMGMLGNLYVLPIQNNLPDGTDLNGFAHHTGNRYVYNDGDGSTFYDVEYALQLSGFYPEFHDANMNVQPLPFAAIDDRYPMINGRGYPETIDPDPLPNTETGALTRKISSLVTATKGQKVLLRLSNLSTDRFYTVSVLGIPMRVVGMCAKILRGPDGKDLSYVTTSVNIGGGESYDVILDTSAVPAGTYVLYCTNLNELSNDTEDFGGMMTEIRID